MYLLQLEASTKSVTRKFSEEEKQSGYGVLQRGTLTITRDSLGFG